MAFRGMPFLFIFPRKLRALKSSPMAWRALGPAKVIALTVEIRRRDNMPPAMRPPVSPNM